MKQRKRPSETPLGEVTFTARQFEIIKFQDYYERPCFLQQSSLADYEQPGVSANCPGDSVKGMHLNLKQVRSLIEVLEQQWVDYGTFLGEDDPEFEKRRIK
jgi:hypothetical protein